MSTTLEKATFPDLGREQCIALTTFRKTGRRVVTPVWFAISLGMSYVETHAEAGKLKRLRHTARVTLAPCTYSGKVTGPVSEGHARILMEPRECTAASAALAGIDPSGVNLESINLSGSNLNSTNLRGANLTGVNLEEADLDHVDLHHANLRGARLTGSLLGQERGDLGWVTHPPRALGSKPS